MRRARSSDRANGTPGAGSSCVAREPNRSVVPISMIANALTATG